jgi:hypothetical protein
VAVAVLLVVLADFLDAEGRSALGTLRGKREDAFSWKRWRMERRRLRRR